MQQPRDITMKTSPARLYDHPDGARIYFEPFTPSLICSDAEGAATVPIEPLAMIALGYELISLGEQMRALPVTK